MRISERIFGNGKSDIVFVIQCKKCLTVLPPKMIDLLFVCQFVCLCVPSFPCTFLEYFKVLTCYSGSGLMKVYFRK